MVFIQNVPGLQNRYSDTLRRDMEIKLIYSSIHHSLNSPEVMTIDLEDELQTKHLEAGQ